MKLYFNSTNNLKTIVKLDNIGLERNYQIPQDQDILGAINELLQKQGNTFGNISEIEVNTGPGSFTGTRVGVTIANALANRCRVRVQSQYHQTEKGPIKSGHPLLFDWV